MTGFPTSPAVSVDAAGVADTLNHYAPVFTRMKFTINRTTPSMKHITPIQKMIIAIVITTPGMLGNPP